MTGYYLGKFSMALEKDSSGLIYARVSSIDRKTKKVSSARGESDILPVAIGAAVVAFLERKGKKIYRPELSSNKHELQIGTPGNSKDQLHQVRQTYYMGELSLDIESNSNSMYYVWVVDTDNSDLERAGVRWQGLNLEITIGTAILHFARQCSGFVIRRLIPAMGTVSND